MNVLFLLSAKAIWSRLLFSYSLMLTVQALWRVVTMFIHIHFHSHVTLIIMSGILLIEHTI